MRILITMLSMSLVLASCQKSESEPTEPDAPEIIAKPEPPAFVADDHFPKPHGGDFIDALDGLLAAYALRSTVYEHPAHKAVGVFAGARSVGGAFLRVDTENNLIIDLVPGKQSHCIKVGQSERKKLEDWFFQARQTGKHDRLSLIPLKVELQPEKTLTAYVENRTGDRVEGFNGTLVVKNSVGAELGKLEVAEEARLSGGGSTIATLALPSAGLDLQALANTPFSELVFEWTEADEPPVK